MLVEGVKALLLLSALLKFLLSLLQLLKQLNIIFLQSIKRVVHQLDAVVLLQVHVVVVLGKLSLKCLNLLDLLRQFLLIVVNLPCGGLDLASDFLVV